MPFSKRGRTNHIYHNILKTKNNIYNIDNVYVINLSNEIDRLRYFNELYNELSLDTLFGNVTRYDAVNGQLVDIPDYWFYYDTYTTHYPDVKPDSAYGTYKSHYNILNNFINSDDEIIIIFEDDIIYVDEFKEQFRLFYNNVPDNWDALYLGYTCPDKNVVKINKYCNRSLGSNLLHSYILNKKGAIKFMKGLDSNKTKQNFYANEPGDCQFYRMHQNMYVYIPTEPLVNQNTTVFKSGTYK